MAEERSFGDASLQELLIVWAPLLLSFTLPLLSLLLAVVKPCFGCPLSRRVGGMRSAAGRLNALLRFRRRVEARVEEAKVEEARIETRAKHGLKQGNERQSSGESVALGIRSVHDSYRPRARSQSPNDSVAEDSERRSQRSRSFTHKAVSTHAQCMSSTMHWQLQLLHLHTRDSQTHTRKLRELNNPNPSCRVRHPPLFRSR